jgi:hypothetical protein
VVNEVWETMDDHLAHLLHPVHVDMIAFGSDRGMRDVFVHHWEQAEGHIARGRERTEQRLDDPSERHEMYRKIDEARRSSPAPVLSDDR